MKCEDVVLEELVSDIENIPYLPWREDVKTIVWDFNVGRGHVIVDTVICKQGGFYCGYCGHMIDPHPWPICACGIEIDIGDTGIMSIGYLDEKMPPNRSYQRKHLRHWLEEYIRK